MVRTTSNACAQRVGALAGTLLALAGLAGPVLVSAGVVTTPFTQAFLAGGRAEEIQAPRSVEPGKLANSGTIKIFREQEKFILPSPVLVDVIGDGRIESDKDLSYGNVGAGLKVNVYFIHADAGDAPPGEVMVGTMEFEQPILGVLTSHATLTRSDEVIGAPGTIYPMTQGRGVELDAGDSVEISGDRKSMRVRLNPGPSGDIDQVRVITLAEEDSAPTGMSGGYGGGLGGGMGDGTSGGPERPPVGGDVPLMGDGGGGSGTPARIPDAGTSSAAVPETPKDMVPPTIPPPKDSTPDNPNDPPDDQPPVPAPGGLVVMGVGAGALLRRRRP